MRVPALGGGENKFKEYALGDLKKELVIVSAGQKIAYVVDTVYSEMNKTKIIKLVQSADVFFCESPFIAEEEERARERCHLTSRQAGLLAHEAQVKELRIFHFSPKHTFRKEQLYREAEEAFRKGPITEVSRV